MGDAGEIAKASSPLIENLAKLTGPACEQGGLYFGELIGALRRKNATTIADGAVRMLEGEGKQVKPVPPRLLLPIIDAASLEDNPTLQEMWSRLLATASDQADGMSPSYAETLKALTPIEARSLRVLYETILGSGAFALGDEQQFTNFLTFNLGLAIGEAVAPVLIRETLERLGLIARQYQIHKGSPGYGIFPVIDYLSSQRAANDFFTSLYPNQGKKEEPLPALKFEFVFTSYGVQFMRACHGPLVITAAQFAEEAETGSV